MPRPPGQPIRPYTVAEIDALRRAVNNANSERNRMNHEWYVGQPIPTGDVEQQVRTYMLNGTTAEDVDAEIMRLKRERHEQWVREHLSMFRLGLIMLPTCTAALRRSKHKFVPDPTMDVHPYGEWVPIPGKIQDYVGGVR